MGNFMSYYPPAKVLIESNDPQSALESGRKATKDESGEKVGSTGGLQILLLQQCLRDNFRGFISSQWIPSENNSDFQYYPQTNPRKVALSCVDFLSDAQDFTSLRPSAFHEYRAYHIYEKYIVHGCMFPVPLSMNTKDDCTDALFCSKGELDPTLFAIAESEVLDFLAAEVYPMFERTNLAISLSGKDKNSGALSSATDSLAKLGTAINTRRKSLFKSPDRVALTTIMNKILADPTYLASFKTYMCSVGAENFLYAYNDAVELKERLQNLLRMDCSPSPRGDGDADRNEGLSCPNDEEKEEKSRTSTTPSQQALSIAITPRTSVQGSATAAWQVFFHYVNTFYDTYLSLGARFRLNIRTNTMNTFHLQLSQANGVDPNVVSSIEQCTFETLIRDHLDKFLNTSEYRHLVRKGRGSILVIAAGLQERLDIDPSRKADIEAAVRKQKTSVQTNSYFGGSADADDVDTGSDNQITEMGDSFATTASDSTAVGASASADANANASASRKLSKVPDLSSSLFSSANGYGNSNEADVVTRLELKNYIQSSHHPAFTYYMEDNCSSALVHFYQAACTFQITKYRNSLERVAVCRDIFDRYISRNSDDLIGLPENIRAEIVAGVTNAPSYLFRNAAEITFQYMHDVHWNRFKQIVYEKAVRDTNIFQEDKLGASANAAVANSELDMHSASAASTLALQATEDNDMHNNLLNITNGSAASLSTQEESALVSASTAAACNKSDVDDEEFGKPKIKHGSKLVFPDKGPTSTVLKQQRELLERQKPPHTEKFADFAKMAFPGDSNGTIASDSASVSDSMSNARLLALEAAAYGITTPVAPVEEKYSKGGFLSNLFRAMTGSGSSSSSSKSGVTGTGTQHNKNSSVVPSKSVITNTNTSKTVIPVLSDSMGGENIRHVSNENNLKGGAGAGDSMTTPDSGTSEVFSLADMLKENCQQARRRSLAHAPDPFFLAADATKNSHSQSHSNSNSNSNSNGDSNGHEKSISHKGASMRIEEKSGTATATATASASASATATATANVAATAATVSGSANTLAAVALASMDSEEKRLTLLSILGHSQCCAVFKSHLEITGSSQTLLFLVELEDYLCIPNPSFQRIRAKKIYGKYMHALSIMPVPVSASTRQSVLEKIQTAGPALFKQAHNEVLEYIESCQLSGFLATSEWEEVKGVLKSKSSNSSNKSSNQSSSSHERNDNRSRKSFVIGSQSEILSDFKSLFNILHNQIATRYFKDFCHRIFVNESLFFWLDVENYIQLPGTDYMKRAALKISRKYIFDNAQQQINISHSTRTEILKALINPSRVLFKRAQQEIFKLLEQDALPKFIRSSEFKSMQETLQTAASIQQEKQGDGGGGGGFAVFGRSLSRLVSR